MKQLVQVINRATFGRYSTNRYLARTAARLELLVQAGNAQAMYRLAMLHWDGRGMPENRAQALPLLHAAAAGGVRSAIYNLAVAYDNGYGVAQSHYRSFQYYEQAAGLGDVEAMHAVGSFYYWGEGTAQDYTKARYWYRKSAKLGNADGMHDLARCYQRGVGGAKNQRQAVCWFTKALAAGCQKSKAWLGLAYASKPLEDWPRARFWLEQAAEDGYAHAMYGLGTWAAEGWHGPANLADALFWFQRAADLGHKRAALRLAELHGEAF